MSKEIELKYNLTSPALGQEILQSSFMKKYALKDSRHSISMKAVYYDDENLTLTSKKIGYRIRKENDSFVATVKWTQKQDDRGLSVRHEYNIDISDEKADPSIFKNVIHDPDTISALCSIDPVPLFITEFNREIINVAFGSSIIETAFDEGVITNGKDRQIPICELESELKEGNEADLTAFGELLADAFSLAPLSDSKLKRGLSLIL